MIPVARDSIPVARDAIPVAGDAIHVACNGGNNLLLSGTVCKGSAFYYQKLSSI